MSAVVAAPFFSTGQTTWQIGQNMSSAASVTCIQLSHDMHLTMTAVPLSMAFCVVSDPCTATSVPPPRSTLRLLLRDDDDDGWLRLAPPRSYEAATLATADELRWSNAMALAAAPEASLLDFSFSICSRIFRCSSRNASRSAGSSAFRIESSMSGAAGAAASMGGGRGGGWSSCCVCKSSNMGADAVGAEGKPMFKRSPSGMGGGGKTSFRGGGGGRTDSIGGGGGNCCCCCWWCGT
mmetsp:Transcript_19543/g.54538  ORF Transcript_19543/g.54538 Transcript_19543/m.54538 type:complete len:237 (+) Transcript_19543:795-1505(+)